MSLLVVLLSLFEVVACWLSCSSTSLRCQYLLPRHYIILVMRISIQSLKVRVSMWNAWSNSLRQMELSEMKTKLRGD